MPTKVAVPADQAFPKMMFKQKPHSDLTVIMCWGMEMPVQLQCNSIKETVIPVFCQCLTGPQIKGQQELGKQDIRVQATSEIGNFENECSLEKAVKHRVSWSRAALDASV